MSKITSPKQVKIAGAVKRLFNLKNEDARIVLHHLIKSCHVMTPTFVGGSPDLSAFREGQRHVVCSLLTFINKDLDKVIEQIRELENETIT
jgi:hypothetical protein